MPRGKHDNHSRGNQHYAWTEERIISSHGYIKVRVGETHLLADPNGYTYEHLLVWVSAGNFRPKNSEIIHHRNGDKKDNRLENLQLMSRSEHSCLHNSPLSDDQIVSIRTEYANKEFLQPELAARYGVPIQRISKIIRGETRRQAGGPISDKDHRQSSAG